MDAQVIYGAPHSLIKDQLYQKQERLDENDSEQNDKVKSLSSQSFIEIQKNCPQRIPGMDSLNSVDNDAPFNFQMEKFDSLMIESDDSGLTHTLSSQKVKKLVAEERKYPIEIVQENQQQKNKKTMLLSRLLRRQMFNNFKELQSASKNLLNREDGQSLAPPVQGQMIQPNIQGLQLQQVIDRNLIAGSHAEQYPAVRESQQQIPPPLSVNQNLQDVQCNQIITKSIKPNPYQIKEEEKIQINKSKGNLFINHCFKDKFQSKLRPINVVSQVSSNQKFIKCQNAIEEKLKIKSIEEHKKGQKARSKQLFIKLWEKNTIMHPSEYNSEYDVMDKNQLLKNFPEMMENLEAHQNMDDSRQPGNQDDTKSPISSNVSKQLQKQSQDTDRNPNELSPLSFPNVGSKFEEVKNPQGLNKIQNENEPQYSSEKQIMLIVEDSQFIQKTIQAQLGALGVDFEECLDGLQGFKMAEKYLKEKKLFNIILMDMAMPVMNGFESAQKIRELEKKYGVSEKNRQFICGYSAQVSLNVEKKCFESGMDDVCAKPMEFKAMQRMLNQHDYGKMEHLIETLNSQSASNHGTNQPISPISDSRSQLSSKIGKVAITENSNNESGVAGHHAN